jgi:hypothetical protein
VCGGGKQGSRRPRGRMGSPVGSCDGELVVLRGEAVEPGRRRDLGKEKEEERHGVSLEPIESGSVMAN